jgi:hypothetical protein
MAIISIDTGSGGVINEERIKIVTTAWRRKWRIKGGVNIPIADKNKDSTGN